MRLRVLSLNVWGLPAPVGRDVSTRMERINQKLPSFDADVVLYQEVWTDDARAQLIAGGARAGLSNVWHHELTRGGSGLLALSRLPIRAVDFTPYRLCGLPQRLTHADYYSGKGFARLVVDLGDAPVTIIGTHLHARYAPASVVDEYLGQRTAEVIEFSAGVREVTGPIVAAGDFNLREGSVEYRVLLDLTGLDDVAVELDNRQITSALANPYRAERGAIGESRIDYVFTRAGERHGVKAVRIARVFDETFEIDGTAATYSDHAGLLADLELDGGGESQSAPAPLAIAKARALLAHGREAATARRTFERTGAIGSLAAAGAAAAFARRPALTRRRLLRAGLYGGALLAAGSTVGFAALSEHFVPEELAGFERVEQLLDEIAAAANTRGAAGSRPALRRRGGSTVSDPSLAWNP